MSETASNLAATLLAPEPLDSDQEAKLRQNFALVKQIIAEQEMLARVPAAYLEFSLQHLEGLVKFAYFGGFIQLGQARQLLLLPKEAMKPKLRQWYEEVREQGCWLC
ncbi:MAG: hypothetical protein ACUVRZ_02230 [Desulfobacca sp.]|uniref:hypothetical protein n=1 Tax=Desulfobacca sp. TaxID=2067990 RepID=UPI00404B2EAC